ATLVLVPLTTMRQPCARIGEMAVRLMVERLADPSLPAREVSFDCELIVRESCGAVLRGNLAHAVG
ncbi:MAG: substrate-binding domain-containing protein, partial [Phycisphaerae bacterium]